MSTTLEHSPRDLRSWRNAITVGFALGGITTASWGPRLPALRTELGVDTGGLGLLLAGVTVGAVAGLGAATPLLARLGARRAIPAVITSAAMAIAVIGVGAGVLHSVPLVAVAFVLAGLSVGALDVMVNVEGAAVEQALARTVMPLMHGAWSAGIAVGSGIGAACAALDIAPSAQFAGQALLLVVGGVLVSRSIPVHAPPVQEATKQPAAQRVREWARGWADPRLLLIGVVMLGVNLGEGSANSWLTLSAQDGHGLSPATAALFFTVFALTEMAARIGGGPIVDRLGRVATIRVTTALGVAGTALFILVDHPAGILAGVVLWAVGVSMGFPLGMSAAATGPNPAARVAVVASLGYFSNLAGPPVVGFVAQGTGLLTALWLIAVLLGVAFLAAGALRDRDEVQSSKR